MRVAKYLNHLGVDNLLKSALGEDLTIFRYQDTASWITRDQIPFDYVDGDIEPGHWDVFIFDDIYTVTNYFEQGVRAENHVWYCHGTFDTWRNAQVVFNMRFENLHMSAIFTDDFKRTLVDQWREFALHKTLTLPIALDDSCYSTVPEKNGRVCTIGNDYHRICSIYPRYKTFARPALETLLDRYGHCYDAYGWNGESDGELLGNHRRGPAQINQLGAWSASVHLSGVASIGFVLAECFAAGIPVIATPKWQLPRDGSWICVETLEEMTQALDQLISDAEFASSLGTQGQKMFRQHFGLSNYSQQLKSWLASL